MKTKVIEGQVNIFNNSFKEESEVINVEDNKIVEKRKANSRYPDDFNQYCINLFMEKYFKQYKEVNDKYQHSNNSIEEKRCLRKLRPMFFSELRLSYPEMFAVTRKGGDTGSDDTIWGWIKNIPEFDAIRPKRCKKVKSFDADETSDVVDNIDDTEITEAVINLQPKNEVRTVYTGTVSEDELYEPSSTFDANVIQQSDECSEETAIADINETAIKVEEENETYIWEVKIDYQMVSGKLFKKYLNCTYSGKYIAVCANDAYVQALDYLADNAKYNIIYPKSDNAIITKQGVVKSSC